MKKIGDLTVNDGKGLMDNEGMCDSLINDLNDLVKQFMNGQYIIGCSIITGMSQKLLNLKNGIADDMQSMQDKVEELKRLNDHLTEQNTGLPVEKGFEDGKN